jgi:dTDP-L-rhamnose 4-epimerase
MTRALVTGGAGFIGSHTVDLLLAKGYEVRVLDNLQPRVHPKGKPSYIPKEVDFIQGDVANRADMTRALDGVEAVFHIAAYQDYLTDFSTFIHTNAESSALIFELILEKKLPVRKIVFASSQSVAGDGRYRCAEHGIVFPLPRPMEQMMRGEWEVKCPTCSAEMTPMLIEESTAIPATSYAISKYAIELLAERLGRRYGIPTVCMRYTYVQGTRNSFYNAYSGIMRIFTLRIMNGLPPLCYEDGMQQRDYVNVKDVARANVLAMEHDGANFKVLNVGGGRAIRVVDFAQLMLKAFGKSLEPMIPGQFRVGDTRHTVSDISECGRLGWKPEIPVEQNIREYLEWIDGQDLKREYLDQADREMSRDNAIRTAKSSAASRH